MASGLEEVTDALRRRSPDALRDALAREVRHPRPDPRDVMVAMAPYHDCARRLRVDRVALFDEAAEGLPLALAELVRGFGRRRDVRARNFGFSVKRTRDGPEYRWDSSW